MNTKTTHHLTGNFAPTLIYYSHDTYPTGIEKLSLKFTNSTATDFLFETFIHVSPKDTIPQNNENFSITVSIQAADIKTHPKNIVSWTMNSSDITFTNGAMTGQLINGSAFNQTAITGTISIKKLTKSDFNFSISGSLASAITLASNENNIPVNVQIQLICGGVTNTWTAQGSKAHSHEFYNTALTGAFALFGGEKKKTTPIGQPIYQSSIAGYIGYDNDILFDIKTHIPTPVASKSSSSPAPAPTPPFPVQFTDFTASIIIKDSKKNQIGVLKIAKAKFKKAGKHDIQKHGIIHARLEPKLSTLFGYKIKGAVTGLYDRENGSFTLHIKNGSFVQTPASREKISTCIANLTATIEITFGLT